MFFTVPIQHNVITDDPLWKATCIRCNQPMTNIIEHVKSQALSEDFKSFGLYSGYVGTNMVDVNPHVYNETVYECNTCGDLLIRYDNNKWYAIIGTLDNLECYIECIEDELFPLYLDLLLASEKGTGIL